MNRTTPKNTFITLVLVLVMMLGAVPAYGVTSTPVPRPGSVPSHARVGGLDLYSLDATAARIAIASASSVPSLAPIAVKGDGHKITVAPSSALSVDVEAMLTQAYVATDTVTPFDIVPVYVTSSKVVSAWSSTLAKKVDRKARDAKRTLKGHSLVVSKEVAGVAVNKPATSARITAAIRSELASAGAAPVVVASLKTIKPHVTRKNIGKAILVVLSKFSVKLYNGTKVEKSYHCAIGMAAFPTPTGKWKVTGKVKNPSWHNPGSAWAKGMPSVIGPGPSNPLGTRAIYLNASGIRFHGTAKYWSIGHAASHGCMRMRRADVEDFYPRVPVGITVWIIR